MKIERLLNILMYLVNHPKCSARELSNHFNVSTRTIQRDIDHLTLAGFPIYADTGRTGGYTLMEHYRVDRSFLKAGESSVLKAIMTNLQESVPDGEVSSACNKLLAMMPSESESEKLVIRMTHQFDDQRVRHVFSELSEARDEHLVCEIEYIDLQLNETKRQIEVYTLVMLGSVWYVYGYCLMRQAYRMFKISRIIGCKRLNGIHFVPRSLPEKFPWDQYMPSDQATEHVVLELDRCLLGRLSDYFSYTNCSLKEDKVIATFDFPVDEWFYTLILPLVPHVKVIEPEHVRNTFVEKMKRAIEINEKL